MPTEIIAKVIAFGVPALLIILGFIAVTGGELAGAIFGTSGGMVVLGVIMIAIGIIIYVVELILH